MNSVLWALQGSIREERLNGNTTKSFQGARETKSRSPIQEKTSSFGQSLSRTGEANGKFFATCRRIHEQTIMNRSPGWSASFCKPESKELFQVEKCPGHSLDLRYKLPSLLVGSGCRSPLRSRLLLQACQIARRAFRPFKRSDGEPSFPLIRLEQSTVMLPNRLLRISGPL
jgi:hypothetical protein